MSGDISAINCWARSTAQRARAIAMNTGCSVEEAKERLIREDAAAAKAARNRRVRLSLNKAAAR